MQEREEYTTGIAFGIKKERQLMIADRIQEILATETNMRLIEEKIKEEFGEELGEAYVAGFITCYIMMTMRRKEDIKVRKAWLEWLLGILDDTEFAFAPTFPIRLIEDVVTGGRISKHAERTMEKTLDYLKKKEAKKSMEVQ